MAQTPDEKTYVESPFIEQLKGMGWDHIEGDIDVPYLTERESFRDVLLTKRLVSFKSVYLGIFCDFFIAQIQLLLMSTGEQKSFL